eukprot:TRINITY_DN15287_c1_g1_i1.p1 TRINITY_DN15287_c1_g1~~TRINITY_DN15287_c1_g1_i1.p1  ORF type:complete len:104 (+),score=18.16 TRINITY_DN15287_c1_g1_i1:867-1178(+)
MLHMAVAVLDGPPPSLGILGIAHLVQNSSSTGVSPTVVHVRMQGLRPGKYCCHVHEYGDTRMGVLSTEQAPSLSGERSPDGRSEGQKEEILGRIRGVIGANSA